MYDADEHDQRDHQRTMEKLGKATEIAKAFADSKSTDTFELDVHIDRYGDTKISVRVNRRSAHEEAHHRRG